MTKVILSDSQKNWTRGTVTAAGKYLNINIPIPHFENIETFSINWFMGHKSMGDENILYVEYLDSETFGVLEIFKIIGLAQNHVQLCAAIEVIHLGRGDKSIVVEKTLNRFEG